MLYKVVAWILLYTATDQITSMSMGRVHLSTFTAVCNIHYDVSITDHTTDTSKILSPSTKHSNTDVIYIYNTRVITIYQKTLCLNN